MTQVGTDEERLEKMVAIAQVMLALIKGVVDVGVVLSLKPILKSWQLRLSFKLDVLTTEAPTTERILIMSYCLLLSFFFICA